MSDESSPPEGADPPEGREPSNDLPPAGEPEDQATPVDPVGVDRPPRSRWASARSAAGAVLLGALAFAATAALLVGILALGNRPSGTRGTAAEPSPVAAATTPAPTSGTPGPSPERPTPEPVGSGASASPDGTAGSPAPAADPVLVGAGDIADCSLEGGAATAALLDRIEGTVFTAGDNVYPDGSLDRFRDCYGPSWGRHLGRTRPAAGNHDWETRDLAGYLGYFGAAAAPNGTSWYSYDLGTWHVIVLDSDCAQVAGCGADSPQGRWLAADLAGSSARCTMAIWHHPRFSSGEHGNDPTVGPFWRALYDAGADVVVNGHDHDYERFVPQDPDARPDDARGLREFVVGTGGAGLRRFPTIWPNSAARSWTVHGVIRFVLHPTGYDWRFVPVRGDFDDAGSGTCH